MKGRKLYREYAQLKGKEAKEFVKVEEEWMYGDILITKSNSGELEKTTLDYKEMVHWIIKTKKLQK